MFRILCTLQDFAGIALTSSSNNLNIILKVLIGCPSHYPKPYYPHNNPAFLDTYYPLQ